MSRSGEMRVDFRAYGWFPAPGTIATGVQNAGEEGEDGDAAPDDDADPDGDEADAQDA